MTQPKSPSALMVFLFTDLVDSTAWKQTLRDLAYAECILQPHNELCRKLLFEFPEAKEKNFTGDGFLIAFTSPSTAVQFALRFHEALHSHPWNEIVTRTGRLPKTRIGIHLGEAIAYADSNPDETQITGQAVDLAARIMGLAAGGQTLLTRHTFDSARQYVTDERLSWLNHGQYRCKGSDDPLEVCEVGVPGQSPLAPPADSDKAKRVKVEAEDDTGSWRPAAGLPIPRRDGWAIERKLGEGGFGEVWLARHQRMKERRVFKFCFDAERLRSFKRELTFFKLIKNELGERPDIAKLHEVQVELPPFFLESEFVESGNLSDWSQAQGGLDKVPPATRMRLMIETAGAVAAAHSLGIIHKDLKPSNILIKLDRHGQPHAQLNDFGIGILADRTFLHRGVITETGFTESVMFGNESSRTGTRLYSPPEANLGKPATTGFDVYALGVMLYQLVVGDFSRALGTGWQENVSADGPYNPIEAALLLEDITAATHGDPAKRLPGAALLGERLANLETRCAERLAEVAKEEDRRLKLARERRLKRLRWLSAGSIALIFVMGALGLYAWQAKNRADAALDDKDLALKEAETQEAKAKKQAEIAKENEAKANKANEETKKANEEANHLLANATLSVADGFYAKGQLSAAYKQLRQIPEEWRGWEWRYRMRHYDNADAVFYGHTNWVLSVSWSPDGKRIASASKDKTIRIWDAVTGHVLLIIKGHTGTVHSVSWSPDGRKLASAGGNTIGIWDAATGHALLLPLREPTGRAIILSWSPDGRRLASTSHQSIRIWDAATGQELGLPLGGHTGEVRSVSWSPDGRNLASASDDGTIRIWDCTTGQELRKLKGHTGEVRSVSWSPDGRSLASGSNDGKIRIWDRASGRSLRELKGRLLEGVTSVSWSPDGKRLASASLDETIRIWDAVAGQVTLELKGHAGQPQSVSWSPDGRRLASASLDATVRIWDTAAGQGLLDLKRHTEQVNCVAWRSDGRRAASASGDKTIRIWDMMTGQSLSKLTGHTESVRSLAWHPDGQRLASASDDTTIRIWDAATGQALRKLEGHTDKVTSVLWSPNGRRLASASNYLTIIWDGATGNNLGELRHTGKVLSWSPDGGQLATANGNRVVIWDVATRQQVLELKEDTFGLNDISWSPNGQRLATGNFGTIHIWDSVTGRRLFDLTGHTRFVNGISWSPDGQRLASASWDKTIRIWDAATGQGLLELTGHTDGVNCVSWSSDGQKLLSASADKTIRIWDVPTRRGWTEVERHAKSVLSVSWSPDGKRLASTSEDETIRTWDATTGQAQRVLKGHTAIVRCASWSPDGRRLASASDDQVLRIWDATTGQNLGGFNGHTGWVFCVSWSPDGRRLASASGDKTIRIWDAATRKALLILEGHTQAILSVAWSPDGQHLASASSDRTIRIWDVATGNGLGKFEGHTAEVNSVAWSPNGQHLASASSDKTIRIWDVATGNELGKLEGHTADVNSVAWSPNGQHLASAASDETIRIWDAATGQNLRKFKGRSWKVVDVSWSPNGQQLASASDETIQIWDANTGKGLMPWAVWGPGTTPSADRRIIAVACPSGSVVRLIPLEAEPDELAFREAKARFDPFWAKQQAKGAEDGGDAFAAAFFNSTLAEASPANEENWLRAIEAGGKISDYRHSLAACNRLLMREPGLAPIYRQRAIIRQQALDVDGASGDLLTAALLRPTNINGWPDFADAATDHREYDWAWRWEPNNLWHGHRLAWQQLQTGEELAYRATLRHLYDRFSQINELKASITISAILAGGRLIAAADMQQRQTAGADAIVYTAAILPDCAGLNAATLQRLAENTFGENVQDGWQLETLGAIHFRAGNYTKAIDALDPPKLSAKLKETNWRCLFLAMAYHRSGKPDKDAKADEWFKKAKKPLDGASWEQVLIWDRLSKEAQTMLKK